MGKPVQIKKKTYKQANSEIKKNPKTNRQVENTKLSKTRFCERKKTYLITVLDYTSSWGDRHKVNVLMNMKAIQTPDTSENKRLFKRVFGVK